MRIRVAKTLEELPLYSKVLEFWDAVAAILKDLQVRRNRKLFDQIDSANDSIDSTMKEGFEQPTDAAFGNFVYIAKGSLEEVVARVRQGTRKGLGSETDLARVEALGTALGKMMGGDRARHAIAPQPPKPR